jgi:alginate O-acetyltransferase complex protein AlgI
LYFAVLLILEKFVLSKLLGKLPAFVRHIYVMFTVAMGWVFFDASGISAIGGVVANMFGLGGGGLAGAASFYYLRSYAVPFIVAAIACTPAPKAIAEKLLGGSGPNSLRSTFVKCLVVVEPLLLGVLLLVVAACLVDGSFNPFIYFRF